jgi:hypothetical protein
VITDLIEIIAPSQMELWQTRRMRRAENPENVVRLHEVPQKEKEKGFAGKLLAAKPKREKQRTTKT